MTGRDAKILDTCTAPRRLSRSRMGILEATYLLFLGTPPPKHIIQVLQFMGESPIFHEAHQSTAPTHFTARPRSERGDPRPRTSRRTNNNETRTDWSDRNTTLPRPRYLPLR